MDKEIESISKEMARNLNIKESKDHPFRFRIPREIKLPLIWTLFFAVAGIIIQSFRTESFVFFSFFYLNYISWIKSFSFLTNLIEYKDETELLTIIFKDWYYFLYSGGVLSFLWSFISYFLDSKK
jgi:hypothetical protein